MHTLSLQPSFQPATSSSKNPLIAVVSGFVQGIFRAGHLVLLALGVFVLSQLLPLSGTTMGGVSTRTPIDALSGGADSGTVPAEYRVSTASLWATSPWATIQTQITEIIAAISPEQGATNEVTPAESPTTTAEASPTTVATPVLLPTMASDAARLSRYIATRYRVSDEVVASLVLKAKQVGKETGVDPLLIVSVMAIESSFNPLSQSRVGAQGLMQIIPKYHMDKLSDDADHLALFDPETNIHVGALVLREYIRRTGSVEAGLQFYAGASNDEDRGYSRKVLGTRDKLAQVMRG
jgi:hypothetical protein